MDLKSLTRADVRDIADSLQIFQRGEQYHATGAVYQMRVSPGEITARVRGNYGSYTTTILDDSGFLETDCDCPYDGDVCKHIVAVLLNYLEGGEQAVEPAGREVPEALKQTLAAMTHEQLLDLILNLAGERSDFRRVLLANVNVSSEIIGQMPEDPEQVKNLKRQITDFFNEVQNRSLYDDGYYYQEYDEGEKYPELEPIFETARMLNPADQIEVFWHVLTSANSMFEEYPIGTDQIEEAIGLYAEAARELNLPEEGKHPFLDSLVSVLGWEMAEYGNIIEALKGSLDAICKDREDYIYLIGRLQKSDHLQAPDWIAHYYLAMGDEENYLRVRQKNLETESQYVELADYWESKGEHHKYIATLEEWVENLYSTRGDAEFRFYGYATRGEFGSALNRLADHYNRVRDDDNLCRVLMAVAEFYRFPMDLYRQIKEVSRRTGRWEEARSALIEIAKRDTETLAKIYLYEEDWEAALQLANQKGIYEPVRILVADGVKEHYPKEAIEIYQKLVQDNIDRQSRKHYKTAAHYADKIKNIYLSILNDEEGWQRYVTQVRNRYPRHTALQDEFRRL